MAGQVVAQLRSSRVPGDKKQCRLSAGVCVRVGLAHAAGVAKILHAERADFDLDLNAPRPEAWYRFLESLWPDDKQSVATLQEMFGYLLTLDTRQQKIFLLVGPKRSGKGTIARVLTGIVGKGNVAAPTLAGMATNFGLWSLIGKSVAIISDARLSGRADQVAVVERLLSISGEDAITIDRKNLQPLTCRVADPVCDSHE